MPCTSLRSLGDRRVRLTSVMFECLEPRSARFNDGKWIASGKDCTFKTKSAISGGSTSAPKNQVGDSRVRPSVHPAGSLEIFQGTNRLKEENLRNAFVHNP